MVEAYPKSSGLPGARSLAFTALWRVEVQGAYAELALDSLFEARRIKPADRALATEIVMGVLRHRSRLDHYLAQAADRPLSRIERNALIALRIGAYQLLMLDRVPARAAVNESVSLAPASSRGFVNAVLRALADRRRDLIPPENIADELERISVLHSHPRWLVAEWVKRLGAEPAAALCRTNNQRPALTLRVNTLRTGRDMLLRRFEKEGIEARPGRWSELAVILSESRPPAELPGYQEGLFAVQDEASQLAAIVLGPRPDELILDACAAPGTKSLQLMQMMEGRGRVVALDAHEGRLSRMAAEAKRLGLRNVTRVVGDAAAPLTPLGEGSEAGVLPEKFHDKLFDRVLVDAPCTGLGTIRRRPEIKWRRGPEDAASRSELQRSILVNVSRWLRPGGTLVYSTCTFTVEENERVVAALLETGNFSLADPAEGLPEISGLVEERTLRTWPHLAGTDGFTIFKLIKKVRSPGRRLRVRGRL